MRDVGCGVEQVVDTMTGVRADDGTVVRSCNWLTCFTSMIGRGDDDKGN